MVQKLNLPATHTQNIVHVQMSNFAEFLRSNPSAAAAAAAAAMEHEEEPSAAAEKAAAAKSNSKRGAKPTSISFAASSAAAAPSAAAAAADSSASSSSSSGSGSSKPVPNRKRLPEEKAKHRVLKAQTAAQALEVLRGVGFDSLVVASRFAPEPIVAVCAPYLSGSAAVAVYASRCEPLARIHALWKNREQALRDREERDSTTLTAQGTTDEPSKRQKLEAKTAASAAASSSSSSAAAAAGAATDSLVHTQLTECWYREQQVLPNRTHPLMQMSATGGYVLSAFLSKAATATTTVTAPAPAAAAAAAAVTGSSSTASTASTAVKK
jgi:hypothetical protein